MQQIKQKNIIFIACLTDFANEQTSQNQTNVGQFLRAKAECFERLCHRLGVCLSVCLSVRLSHS